ncbi:MAG TPA: helix-turn-helix transcriptional regulator [Puia sp.]|jgi:transcriptional regulator with XRE-family HTH domain
MTTQQLLDSRIRIGSIITSRRKELGLTQKALAETTGILQTNISRIEKGKYSVGIDQMSKIAAALKCEINFDPKHYALL